MQHYETGDVVFLFGFSRRAVRTLAGMLYKCGVLGVGQDNLVEYASKIYNTDDNAELAAGFRRTFPRPCPVHFIGVWDTVASLALNAGKRFHDATLNPEVAHGYHALAIDEKRRDFAPSPWDEADVGPGQTVEQVWFAGAHSDVGGWSEERGLSNVALHWMLGKAAACGLRLDQAALDDRQPDPHDRLHPSHTGLWKMRGMRVRKIPAGTLIHRSVVERMQNPRNHYRPANLPAQHTVVD